MGFYCRLCGGTFEEIPRGAVALGKRRGPTQVYQIDETVHVLVQAGTGRKKKVFQDLKRVSPPSGGDVVKSKELESE